MIRLLFFSLEIFGSFDAAGLNKNTTAERFWKIAFK